MMHLTTLACLFVGKDGGLAVRVIERPVPEEVEIPPIPPGMRHAAQLLGLLSSVRVFKQTAGGALPVYEEV
jgi:hypothetical protein